jgi:hypothetical protein
MPSRGSDNLNENNIKEKSTMAQDTIVNGINLDQLFDAIDLFKEEA